ncbi:MAG TPA: hypothetical protein VID04_01395 [Methylomirabilota bacterium]
MRGGQALARGAGLALMLVLAWQVAARGVSFRRPGAILGILDGANFIFHEGGHVLFAFFGQFLYVLGGSLTQVALPLVCTVYFWRAGRPAAAAATLFWSGESLTNVAVYVADGRARALPLHGGYGVIHDWYFLLSRLGLLGWAEALGGLAFALGFLLIVAAIVLLGLDLWRLLAAPPDEGEPAPP